MQEPAQLVVQLRRGRLAKRHQPAGQQADGRSRPCSYGPQIHDRTIHSRDDGLRRIHLGACHVDRVDRRRDRLTALPAVGFARTSLSMTTASAPYRDPLLERQNSLQRNALRRWTTCLQSLTVVIDKHDSFRYLYSSELPTGGADQPVET